MAHTNRTRETLDRSPHSVRGQQPQSARLSTPLILQRAYADPSSLTPRDIKHLQRTIGNSAVIGLLSKSTGLQAALKLGPAGDPYEQEADRVAQQVVRQIDRPQPVQRESIQEEDELAQAKPLSASISSLQRTLARPTANLGLQRQELEEEELQAKRLSQNSSPVQRSPHSRPQMGFVIRRQEQEEDELQMKPLHGPEGGAVEQSVEKQIQTARGGGKPLDNNIRGSMEQGFGADFSRVRVHTGGQADALNRSLNAKAFTVGNDVFFGKGQYNPGNSAGKQLLAHELTHTVQQGAAGVQRDLIQRRIGFEVETGIPITEVMQVYSGTHYYNISPDQAKIEWTNGDISPDHVPIKRTAPEPNNEHFGNDLPIVEFVSDAVAEDMSDGDFLDWALDALDQLKALKDNAKQASPPGNNRIIPRFNFGLPSNGITYEDRNWNRISVQATLDVGLAKVSNLVSQHGSGGQGLANSEIDQAQVAQRASGVAEAVLKAYEKNHWGQKKKNGRAEVKGLMTMIVHHLLIGTNPQAQKMIYAKNRLGGVMYKTKLSTLVRNMGVNAYWAQIIAKNTRRPKLINHLITQTNRTATEPVYLGYQDPVVDRQDTADDRSSAASDIDVRTWLREVLSGIDDKMFDELKNEWSEEITPPSGIAAIEVRKPQSFLDRGLQNIALSIDNPDGVANYLLQIYKWNRML
jgi:hypothetical protein